MYVSISLRSDYVIPSFKNFLYFFLAYYRGKSNLASMSSCLSTLQSQASLQSSRLSTLTLRLLPWEPLVGPAKILLFPASQPLHRLFTLTTKLSHSFPIRCLPWKLLFIHLEWAYCPFWAKLFEIPVPSIAHATHIELTLKDAPSGVRSALLSTPRPLSSLVPLWRHFSGMCCS